jgi:putative ABC transport system substrate-binding protein
MGGIRRRQLLIAASAMLAAPFAASQPERMRRVGFVFSTSALSEMAGPEPVHPLARAFLREMRALGWIEGRNLALERRTAEGDVQRAPAIFAELAQAGVEVLVSPTTSFTRVAMKATPTVPVVMISSSPVEEGLVQSLARPGGNVTGVTVDVGPEFHPKLLELLKEVLPKAKSVALLTTQGFGGIVLMKAIRGAANASGLGIDMFDAEWSDNKFDAAFRLIEARRPDALLVPGISPHYARRTAIVDFARKMRLPDIHYYKDAVDAGGLCAYGVDQADLFRKMAGYVDRILRGAKPADLPVQQPTRFELAVNLKTAKQLGITFPPAVLVRADRVIE